MSKKNVAPTMSDEEFNSYLNIHKPYTTTGSDTGSSMQTEDGEKMTPPELTLQRNDCEEKMRDEQTVKARVIANAINAARAASVATGVSEPTNEPTEYTLPTTPSGPITPKIPPAPTTPAVSERPSALYAPAVSKLPTATTVLTPPDPLRRPSTRQRKASFDEYRETFLRAPKISDRQPVFLSRTTRDHIDEIARKLGDRKMSVSGFLENLAWQHLENYAEDIEVWKRL